MNKENIVMECSVSYSLSDESGKTIANGEAEVRLEEENISILPKFGESLFFSLRDILEVSKKDYKIFLTLTSKEKLTIFNLGYKYEDFLRVLMRLRNEILLEDMLIHETLKKSGVKGNFVHLDEDGKELKKGKCELRLYETAIVVIPEKGEIERIFYSDISKIQDEDYSLTLTSELGGRFVFSSIGRQYDPFKKSLSDAMNELSLKVQSTLKELLPSTGPSMIRRASKIMKEGKVAKRSELEAISPDLWKELEKKVEATEVKEEYNFLKFIAQRKKMCIGLKRGLMGELTGEYIWFLIPIYSTDSDEPGNAVVMEAISSEGGGKATYFFRIVSRVNYPNYDNIEELHEEVDDLIKKINHCMRAINFRREPIYLPDEKLDEPRYKKYRFAIAKIPELKELRRLFIGRIIHTSDEQWKKDAMDLLKFNVSTHDDGAKWNKGRN
ncbi:MAG: hypothetical protein ACQEQM_08470 [Thermoplasmatota archaeon]